MKGKPRAQEFLGETLLNHPTLSGSQVAPPPADGAKESRTLSGRSSGVFSLLLPPLALLKVLGGQRERGGAGQRSHRPALTIHCSSPKKSTLNSNQQREVSPAQPSSSVHPHPGGPSQRLLQPPASPLPSPRPRVLRGELQPLSWERPAVSESLSPGPALPNL